MNQSSNEFQKLVIDSIIWFFIISVFGLLQFWLSLGNIWFKNGILNLDPYLTSGVFLFFCSGIIISSSYDIWIDEYIDKNIRLNLIFHFILPLMLLILIVSLYFILDNYEELNNKIRYTIRIVLVYSVLYSTA